MSASLKIHDSHSGRLKQLVSIDKHVGIYACGPTVYGRIHVGNARPYVVFSLLKRYLEATGHDVTFVVNITDVNDKLYKAAAERGITSQQLAAEMTEYYIRDTDALLLGRPDMEPNVVDTMPEIISLIEKLINLGHAYESSGDVYFSVDSHPTGELSHRKMEDMNQGEDNSLKRNNHDFALWKTHKSGEDSWWNSPWGAGRPGWHIECSAMAEKFLGLNFHIHGGGIDLLFPHHENELAQTKAASGEELAQIWMHNGMVTMKTDGQSEKMSKSVGNIFLLHSAIEEFGRDALLLFFLTGHYRQPIEFTEETLAAAATGVRRIREAARKLQSGPSPQWSASFVDDFFNSLRQDFNTPRALAVIFDWVRRANSESNVGNNDLREMLSIFALHNLLDSDRNVVPASVITLLDQRAIARMSRDFIESDRLRNAIAELGWQVRDVAGEQTLLPIK